MAKVFLSHATVDATLADAIHAHLVALGHELFLDHSRGDGIAPGSDWEGMLYERLQWADALVCVVTQGYVDSRWCFAEVALAKASGRLIIPLAAQTGVQHPLLAGIQGLAFGAESDVALERLADTLAALDAGGGLAWDSTRPVYPGLDAFDTEDRAVFFGRSRETSELARDIRMRVVQRQPRAVIVVGASGSGKSSLVRAGLLPRLLEDRDWWKLRPFRPGAAPLAALADAFARGRKEVGLASDLTRVSEALPGGLANLAREILLEAPGDRRRLAIVVDQLEEVFTRAGDAPGTFLSALATAAMERDGPVSIVATLRSEFLGELVALPEAAGLRERPFLLAPLGRDQLEDVIMRPARAGRISFEPAVVRELVDDTGSGAALPLLAFTLRRLVDGLPAHDRIDVARYRASGGVRGSLESQAETALAGLSRAGHEEADVLATLMGFVTLDESGRPTGRRRTRTDLGGAASAVIDAFGEARLLTVNAEDGVAVVGVAHETLFTAWKRMADAIAAAADTLRLRRALERAAAEWRREGQSAALLWRGDRLTRALQLVERETDVGEAERELVKESVAAARHIARRESEMLVDRVLNSSVMEGDPELALLYFLAAIDDYAETTGAVAGLRRALARQRKVASVGPAETRVMCATIRDDGMVMAMTDAGTNPRIKPSTRPQPLPPAGEVCVTLWLIGESAPYASAALRGRNVQAMAWSRDGALLAVGVDDRLEVLDSATLGGTAVAVGDAVTAIEVAEDGGAIAIRTKGELNASLVRGPTGQWRLDGELTAGAPFDQTSEEIPAPQRFSHLLQCPHAGRVLDVSGSTVAVYAAEPIDTPAPASPEEPTGAVWSLGPSEGDDVLALDAGGRLKCFRHGPLTVTDLAAGIERSLPWQFALAAGFSGDGRRLALATRTELGVVDLATNEIVARFGEHTDEEGDTYSSVALNHDGTVLVSGSLGGARSHVWDVASGRTTRRVGARWVALSQDGALLAAATHAGVKVGPVDGDLAPIDAQFAQHFAFDPMHAGLIAVAPRSVVEYTLPDGHLAARYPEQLVAVGFSGDGRHVLGRIGDHVLRWPDRSADAVIARARRAVYRPLTQEERDRFEIGSSADGRGLRPGERR